LRGALVATGTRAGVIGRTNGSSANTDAAPLISNAAVVTASELIDTRQSKCYATFSRVSTPQAGLRRPRGDPAKHHGCRIAACLAELFTIQTQLYL